MNWSNNWAAVSAIVAACTLAILVGSLIFRRLTAVKVQNELQLSQQRRITRDLFGEDPDNPGGPKGPSLRQLVTEATVTLTDVALNTRGLSDRMAAAESRLGKLEDKVSFIEDEILRRSAGN